jgi:hypothetical protein
MMRSISFRLTPVLLVLGGAGTAVAQNMPTSQPGYLTIYREYVKTGRAAEHATIEAGWPAAFSKANSPTIYLALTSMTGGNEAWFLVPFASHAAMEQDMKRNDADPALTAELARLSRADAEAIDEVRTLQLRARPDLSMGAFPNLAKVRYYEVTTFRVRLGQEQAFEAASKTWMASAKRNAPGTSYRTYSLMAGGLAGTYMTFATVESYAEFDQMTADGDKVWAGMTPDELGVMEKAVGGIMNIETQRFRVDPTMSYVDQATRALDPAFWMPKKPAGQ